jgi:hypothetical protein
VVDNAENDASAANNMGENDKRKPNANGNPAASESRNEKLCLRFPTRALNTEYTRLTDFRSISRYVAQ